MNIRYPIYEGVYRILTKSLRLRGAGSTFTGTPVCVQRVYVRCLPLPFLCSKSCSLEGIFRGIGAIVSGRKSNDLRLKVWQQR